MRELFWEVKVSALYFESEAALFRNSKIAFPFFEICNQSVFNGVGIKNQISIHDI